MARLQCLTNNVFSFIQDPLVWYSNAGVVVGEKYILVVDSLTNGCMMREFLAALGTVTDKPIRYLVNTHSHADHVYTNHFIADAISIASRAGWEQTRSNILSQHKHDGVFRKLFPEIDFSDGYYSLQDIAFNGRLQLSLTEGGVEIIDLGVGHSESDVVVHLPREQIVFCGDIFMNGLPPIPSEGHVSQLIANLKAIESLAARIYVPGHGKPADLHAVRAQRVDLEKMFDLAKCCYDSSMGYDDALKIFSRQQQPLEYSAPTLLSAYYEFMGRMPETNNSSTTNHMYLLQSMAREARSALSNANFPEA